ncbi:unnamed protein product, partial [Schistosoma mattheei]
MYTVIFPFFLKKKQLLIQKSTKSTFGKITIEVNTRPHRLPLRDIILPNAIDSQQILGLELGRRQHTEKAAREGNMKQLHDTTKKLSGKNSKPERPVKDKEGRPIPEIQQQQNRW